MSAREAAEEFLSWAADPHVLRCATYLVDEQKTHTWEYDPHIDGVVGLTRVGTDIADIVVYLEAEDFETSR